MHLLCAVHLKCKGDAADRVAALYTAALSVGTVAWVGTGAQYQRAWLDMYGARTLLPRPLRAEPPRDFLAGPRRRRLLTQYA